MYTNESIQISTGREGGCGYLVFFAVVDVNVDGLRGFRRFPTYYSPVSPPIERCKHLSLEYIVGGSMNTTVGREGGKIRFQQM